MSERELIAGYLGELAAVQATLERIESKLDALLAKASEHMPDRCAVTERTAVLDLVQCVRHPNHTGDHEFPT